MFILSDIKDDIEVEQKFNHVYPTWPKLKRKSFKQHAFSGY